MITITLHEHDRPQLAPPCKTPADRRLRTRCQAIGMAARGRRHHQMAEDWRVTPRTLPRWRHAERTGGLDGRTIHGAPGRAPRLPARLAPAIGAGVTHGPAGWGLDRANGTAAARAPSRSQPQGIAVSERSMRTLCPKHGVRPSRPTSQDLTGDPDQPAAARPDLAPLKKRRRRCTRLVESR
jgi:hypothetical protein